MPLDHNDWREIQSLVSRLVAQQGEYFVQGKVVKNDPKRKLVWLKEFGDQPIPCVSFDYQVKYYVNTSSGFVGGDQITPRKTRPYTPDVEILVPKVGDIVLVARHLGSRRLPKCLGVIKSSNYVSAEGN